MNIELPTIVKFVGFFEHVYEDSFFKNSSTNYINLAFKYRLNQIELDNLSNEQCSEYRWLDVYELLQTLKVHNYVKDYFRNRNEK